MTRSLRFFGIFFLLLLFSCSGGKNKVGKSNLVPEKDLITILTDIHLADGLLTLPKIHSMYELSDSIMNYIDIINNHGYTKEAMDITMRYYYIENPKKLIKIYDKVLSKLSEMASIFEKERPTNIPFRENLWKGNRDYSFPDPSGTDNPLFDQSLGKSGEYTLIFSVTLFPDDQTFNSHFIAYFCHPDSIETGKRDYLPSIDFIKDGRPHIYSFSKRPQSDSYTHLRGWFIDFDNNPLEVYKHVRIDNIKLTCIPNIL
jgi:hypothetical protein